MDISTLIEKISEMLVLADLDDIQELASLHTTLQELVGVAEDEGVELRRHAKGLSDFVENLILDDAPPKAEALECVGLAVTALQRMFVSGQSAAEVGFPAVIAVPKDSPPPKPKTQPAPEPEAPQAAPQPQQQISPQTPTDLTFVCESFSSDPELLGDFIVETADHLATAEDQLLKLEKTPGDKAAINTVFRGLHTIKGVASFLGLEEIRTVAHETETFLDMARTERLTLSGKNMELAFASIDLLKKMTENIKDSMNGKRLSNQLPDVNQLLASLREATGKDQPESSLQEITQSLIPLFVSETAEHLDEVERQLLNIERNAEDSNAINAIFRAFHTIKGGAVLVGLKEIGAFAHRLESLLSLVREGKQTLRGEPLDLVFDAQAGMKRMNQALDQSLNSKTEFVAPDFTALYARLDVIVSPKKHPAKAHPGTAPPAPEPAAEAEHKDAEQGHFHEVVKVEADKLDKLVDSIGELVISVSMVTQSEEFRRARSPDLARRLGQLNKITRSLQEMGTSLRMVPIKSTFQKMARLVRDLAKKSRKNVDFATVGEDTELDKSVVDQISDPLVHMVRNSIDHGIEDSPADRAAAGKPPHGRVELRAFHRGGNIYIEIADDGRGLDRERIVAKAVEKGLIPSGDDLSDAEVYALIFEPGFSTAAKITEISGRGVGMDVVKRNIEALRGVVEIQNSPGKGSTFSVRLPLTLAIIDGMIIKIADERYIIPTLSVVRTIKPSAAELSTVLEKGEMLKEQDKLIPLIRLRELFGLGPPADGYGASLIVVVEDEGGQTGLLVDQLLGQEQIVIKSLGEALRGLPGVSGGAVMPDGLVGLILDVGGLVKIANGTI